MKTQDNDILKQDGNLKEMPFSLPEGYMEAPYTDMLTGHDFTFDSNSLSAYSYKILKLIR